jgi:hypothetical protein
VDHRVEAVAQHFLGADPEHLGDRRARVAAAARAEDQDEVGRGGDEAAEVGGLAARGGDQGEGQQQRRGEAGDAEHDLQLDQVADVAVGPGRQRADGVERDVGAERREDAQAHHRVGDLDVLVGGEPHAVGRAAGEQRPPGGAQVLGQAPSLLELAAHDRAPRR